MKLVELSTNSLKLVLTVSVAFVISGLATTIYNLKRFLEGFTGITLVFAAGLFLVGLGLAGLAYWHHKK